jgi:hypothetical protein
MIIRDEQRLPLKHLLDLLRKLDVHYDGHLQFARKLDLGWGRLSAYLVSDEDWHS